MSAQKENEALFAKEEKAEDAKEEAKEEAAPAS